MSDTTTVSSILATFVEELDFRRLPVDVVENAKLRILDTVGVCLASIDLPYAQALLSFVEEQGGTPEATLFRSSTRLPAAWAALYNGALAHGNDYDDTHSKSIVHIGASAVPTALAMSEKLTRSGTELITAVVAAYEVSARIGMAASKGFHAQGFHPTGVCGVFSAAVASGKLRRLSALQLAHALGIAGSQASGSMEFLAEGAWTKRMHPGWAAHGGVVATGLAERGYTGPQRILDGRYSLYKLYANTVEPDLARATAGLTEEWEILNTDFKPYPCGHISHPYMDCARKLRHQYYLTPDQIATIELRVPTAAVAILCEPSEDKRRPANAYAARFSLPYAISVMLTGRSGGIEDFSDETIRDPEILALCDRTRYVVDDSLPFPRSFPGWVIIGLRDGQRIEARMDASRGSREVPMSPDDVYEKFTSNAARYLSPDWVQRLWDAGQRLDRLDDVTDFTDLLLAGVLPE
jgi:2-methylcitrate dehydratase PrpD